MTIEVQLSVDLQRVLCAVNRTVFRLADSGFWTAPARGSSDLVLAEHQVAELRRHGFVDVLSNAVLVPTERGRESYRECAAGRHSRHLER